MPDQITAAFEVFAGTAARVELDVDGMTPDEIAAELAQHAVPAISLCHQCGHEMSDPQVGDLIEFTVNGRDYVKDEATGHWVEAGKGDADV